MRPAQLRNVLLALSLERADGEGTVVPADERLAATREAGRTLTTQSGAEEQIDFFAGRAEIVLERLAARMPAIGPALDPPHRWRLVAPLVLAGAALAGWFTQALGTEKLVNILSFPLLGILLWNVAVYLIEAISAAAGLGRPSHSVSSESGPAWLSNLCDFFEFRRIHGDAGLTAAARQGLGDFQKRWRSVHGAATRARLRGTLHLGAALLAAAALAGMYAKGIANEYRAYWESTFLTPESLRGILGAILGPASVVSGIGIPDADSLAALRRSPGGAGGSENAARWIHLHAVTVALFVIGPRLVLAGWQTILSRRTVADPRSVPGVGMYFDRLLADALGTALPVRVAAYCHRLSPTAEAALRRHLEHATGAPVRLEWAGHVPLGEEEAFYSTLRETKDGPGHLVLALDLAATPEAETHGDFLRRARDTLAGTAPDTRLQVCLDAEAFNAARRHLPDYAARIADRLTAWRALAGPLRDDLSAFPAEG